MLSHVRANLLLLAVTLVLCSFVYPLLLWVVGQAVFPDKAEGSLVVVDGKVRGSSLIAQPFVGKEYFQPRPSAAGSSGYDASASGGSNLADLQRQEGNRAGEEGRRGASLLLRPVAARAQGRAAREGARRHADDVRLRPGPAHHAG